MRLGCLDNELEGSTCLCYLLPSVLELHLCQSFTWVLSILSPQTCEADTLMTKSAPSPI